MSYASRVAVVVLTWLCAVPAGAVPPPNRPLPPCTQEDGVERGACPDTSPEVAGSAPGRLSFNSSVGAYIEPQIPACYSWDANNTGNWSPTPCYREVYPITVVGCAYVDIASGRFVEGECSRALFMSSTGSQLFKVVKGADGNCGGEGNFWVYALGGPATQSDQIWSNRGPASTSCAVEYLGPKPDGLYGPTWVKLRAGIEVLTGPTAYDSGTGQSTDFYVPIDGDLRDVGPIAAFEVAANEAGRVAFENTSIHTRDEAMTYRWDFDDGDTATTKDPEHRYREPGTYEVTLTVRDTSGDEDSVTTTVTVDFSLEVDLDYGPETLEVGEPFTVTLVVTNPLDEAVEAFRLLVPSGLRLETGRLAQTSGPTPTVPSTLGPGETVTFTFQVEPLLTGRSTIESGARGRFGAADLSETETIDVVVPPRLDVALATTADHETRIGDEFDVVATLTNNEDVPLAGIKTEPLSLDRSDIISIVSGPTSLDGSDPRVVPLTIAPGETTAIKWRYKADDKGVVEARALVSGRDPETNTLFYVSAAKRIAIQSGAIDVTGVRMSPGSPMPGHFGVIRGTVTNVGTLDVKDIDFTLGGDPALKVVERRLDEQEEEVSPRIALLEVGEARDFVIPFGMTTQADGKGKYAVDVTMTGEVELDTGPSEVSHTGNGDGGLDLNDYWSNLLEDYADTTLEFFEGVNTWGESSTLGGSAVGGGEGVVSALQELGDGLIDTGELVYNTATGEYKLTEKGEQIVQTAVEYYHTRSLKQIRDDFIAADLALGDATDAGMVAGVEAVTGYLKKVDTAYAKGDAREVAKLIAEPATLLVTGLGSEVAAERALAKVWGALVKLPVPRDTLPDMKKAPDPIDDVDLDLPTGKPDPDAPGNPHAEELELRRVLDGEDLKDLPTGVPVARSVAYQAGLQGTELNWMQTMAKKHGIAFFVRPRPESAARFAKAGYNAKPMAIKTKSVNDIDVKWLGWDEWKGKEGLVVMREPKDPWPKMLEAMESGELKWGSDEVSAIVSRYNKRRKEWAEKGALFDKLNAGDGFEIQRYGKTIKTKVTLDGDGVMRFTHNNQPVYSDIDLLHVARPDGKQIPKDLYDQIMREAGPGFDVQHGATMNSGDFDDAAQAGKFIDEYGTEHKRGGDPLVIVQSDALTLGYVKDVSFDTSLPGGNDALYGKAEVTYEGAGFP